MKETQMAYKPGSEINTKTLTAKNRKRPSFTFS
jgi:hypothetical protein